MRKMLQLRKRTWILLALLTVGCAIGYYFNHVSYNNNITGLFVRKQDENLTLIKSIVRLDKQKAESLVNDYTYWDEMVEFVEKPDSDWAETNLATTLLSFGVEGVWVFKPDGTLVYSIKSNEGQVVRNTAFYLTAKEIDEIFDGRRTADFYIINDENQVEEIHGATIHPSDDSERKTTPRGYMFATKDLNASYLNQLGSYTNSTATITTTSPTTSNEELIEMGNSLSSIGLTNWKDETVSYVNLSTELPTLKQLTNEVSRQKNLTTLSYLTFYITIGWLLILYGQGLVVTKKRAKNDDQPAPTTT